MAVVELVLRLLSAHLPEKPFRSCWPISAACLQGIFLAEVVHEVPVGLVTAELHLWIPSTMLMPIDDILLWRNGTLVRPSK